MSELYGWQAGQHARQADDMAKEMHGLAMRKGEQDIQQGEITLQTGEMALTAQKKMIELLNQRQSKATDSQAGSPPLGGVEESERIPGALDELAQMALASGMPTQAADYASKASAIRNQASEIATRQTTQRMKDISLAVNLLNNVHDQRSWSQANSLFAMETGRASPFAGHDYNPAMVEKIKESLLDQKTKATIDATKARAQASSAATKEREARVPLIRAQTALAKTRDAYLRKAGSTAQAPKSEDLRAVSDLINSEYLGSVTPEDARILARPIAERTVQLMRDNNLTRAQAANKAFQEAKTNGDFGGLRKRNQMLGSKTKPYDMPESKEKLKANMYYQGKGKYAGQTLLWDGKQFKIAPAAAVTDKEEEEDNAAADEEALDDQGEPVYDNEHTEAIED